MNTDEPKDKATLEKQWLDELQNSKEIQKYLNGFSEASTKHFMEYYISQKYLWHYSPERNADDNEQEQLRWINLAFNHLELILQKKLFDAQCLWRAEKVQFKEVEICQDFIVWQNDIFNCPFIEPVNEDDIDLYAQYLRQTNVETEFDGYEEWQNYDEIKEDYDTDDSYQNIPEWYEFHNGSTGAGTLMLLPDIRGEKEKFYYDLHFAHNRELDKASDEELEKKRDNRPWLKCTDEDVIKSFVNTFESKEVKNYYNDYSWANRHNEKKEQIMDIIDELLSADEYIPVETHHDWYEALELALVSYRCKKIAEALPMALEQYQMKIQMGIAFSCENKRDQNYIRSIWLNNILTGRRLNGEPEDLNF